MHFLLFWCQYLFFLCEISVIDIQQCHLLRKKKSPVEFDVRQTEGSVIKDSEWHSDKRLGPVPSAVKRDKVTPVLSLRC